jgi:hypothetical protein
VKPEVEARLWQRVDVGLPDQCWEWQGYRTPDGYGRLQRFRGRMELAHRVAWESVKGPIPDGMLVCHTCDNPPCVNPAHLFLGTHLDNARDKMAKGRWRWAPLFGEASPSAKLTDAEVDAIRQEYAAGGVSQRALAARYGVHQVHISRLVRRTRRAA